MTGKPFTFSVKVVIPNDESCCLLLRRAMSSRGNPGKWDFPGGKADLGEGFEEALVREVGEETGLRIAVGRVLGAAESEASGRRVAYLIVEARPVSGQVRLGEEHEAHAWVAVQDLAAADLAPQFRRFAQEYARTHGSRRPDGGPA